MRASYALHFVVVGQGMATFSGGQALASGFRLIARRPLAVLVWALLYLVVALAPQVAMVATIWPDFLALAAERAGDSVHAQAEPDMQQLAALNAKASVFQLTQMVTGVLSATVLAGAVFRGVLEPESRAFAYLKLGRQELWLAVVMVITWVMAALAFFVAMIPAVVVGTIGSLAGGPDYLGGMLAFAVIMLAACGGLIWAFLRFSLGLPMSFAEGQFRLFESWRLTGGHAFKMFQAGVCVTVIVLVAEVVLLVALVVGAGAWLKAAWEAVAARPEAWVQFVPAIVGGGLLTALLGVVVQVLYLAPLADIYRQLAPRDGEAV